MIDRSKFKDTTRISDLVAQDEKTENLDRKQNSSYASFLKIEVGENRFRIYPPHPNEENHPFVQAKQTWWLPREVQDLDANKNPKLDEQGSPIMVIKRRPIFDARIHSSARRDIVYEYIEFLRKILKNDGASEGEIEELMEPVYGNYSKRVQGIVGKPTWTMYADKIDNSGKYFGRLEVGKSVKYRINELVARESSNEPIGTESNNPFTDVEDGRLIIITYNDKATTANDYYQTEINSAFDKRTKMIELHPLSDEDLESFVQYPSLDSLYVDVYTTNDFDLALNGLKIFDDEHNFGVFQHDEFLDIAEKLSELYPEKKQTPKETAPKEEIKESVKEEPVKEQRGIIAKAGDEFDEMDREELKSFCKVNKTGIFIKPSMTDDNVRDLIREWAVEEEVSEKPDMAPTIEEKPEKEFNDLPWDKEGGGAKGIVESTPRSYKSTNGISNKDKMAAIREKLKNN